ncbi:GDSL-type esterase/lipase family protein [Psychromonas sp. MME2]|uniref:GDSL-type esterase/lipase family protein n=1 Tax=unclassified Psychromonas TaxID=2614957 RepID=UPI00339BAE46
MLQQLNPLQPILSFGDSLTFGYPASPHQSYPAQLSKLINRDVINAGVNGELSGTGRLRLERLLDRYEPQLLLLCHGANDMLQQRSLDEMVDNLRAMIALAQARDIQVVLLAIPNTLQLLAPIKQYQYVASEMAIHIDTTIFTTILKQPSLLSDAIHPNALGYQKLAQAIAQLLTNRVQFKASDYTLALVPVLYY